MPKRFISLPLYLQLHGTSVFKTMNAKHYYRYILLTGCLFCLCLFSCMERIDINTDASPPRLVVYGYITTDTTRHAVRITRSTGYFVTTKPEGVSNATVSISYDEGVIRLNESSEEPGLYLTSSGIYGIPGKTYNLHASLDFNGDGITEEYEATSYLPFPAVLDSAAVTVSPFASKYLQVLIWGNLPEESSGNFSLHLLRNGVVMNDSLQSFHIMQDEYIASKKFEALPVFQLNPERERYKLLPGDTLTVQVESLTAEYATFIQNAQQEMWGPIPLFSGPPANLETNIRCLSSDSKIEISGFFTAFSKHKTSMVYE